MNSCWRVGTVGELAFRFFSIPSLIKYDWKQRKPYTIYTIYTYIQWAKTVWNIFQWLIAFACVSEILNTCLISTCLKKELKTYNIQNQYSRLRNAYQIILTHLTRSLRGQIIHLITTLSFCPFSLDKNFSLSSSYLYV